jgi:hypothetical protein
MRIPMSDTGQRSQRQIFSEATPLPNRDWDAIAREQRLGAPTARWAIAERLAADVYMAVKGLRFYIVYQVDEPLVPVGGDDLVKGVPITKYCDVAYIVVEGPAPAVPPFVGGQPRRLPS